MTPTHASRTRRWRYLVVIVAILIGAWLWLRGGDDADRASDTPGKARTGRLLLGEGRSGGGRRVAFDARATLRGHVERPDGMPVPGAEVVIQAGPAALPSTPDDHAHGTPRKAVTDGDGAFVFEDLRAGTYLVGATRDDDVAPTTAVDVTPETTRVTLVVFPGASVQVVVRSAADRAPIAGATVRITDGDRSFGEQWSARTAQSDAQGVARFRGMIATTSHLIAASAPGYAETTLAVHDFQFADRTWTAELLLPRAARIAGRVVDASGHGLAGATVGWELNGQPRPADTPDLFDPFPFHGHMQAVQTDPEGRFTMSVEPGSGCVLAAHAAHQLGEECAVTVAVGGERGGIEIVLRDGGQVSGQVVWADGTPAGGATVIATKRGWIHQPMQSKSYRFETRTGIDGRFDFRGIKRGAFELAAYTEEASSPLVSVDLTKHAAERDVMIRLDYEGTIRGRVIDDTKAPVGYALVRYAIDPNMGPPAAQGTPRKHRRAEAASQHADFALPTSIGATRSDGDGNFEIRGLPQGLYTVIASRPQPVDLPTAFTSTTEVAVGLGETVELVLKGLGGVKGKVVDGSGRPVAAFRVSLAPSLENPKRDQFAVGHRFAAADGSFTLAEVPAGEYRVRIDGEDVTEQVATDTVKVKAGGVADVGTIAVTRGVRRHGIVLAKDGTPAGAARVTVTLAPGAEPIVLESDDDGRFVLPALPADAAIRIRGDKFAATSDWLVVPPGTAEIQVVLAKEGVGAVTGVLIEAGARLERRSVVLTLVGEGTPDDKLAAVRNTVTAEGGTFRFDSVPIGDYLIWVRRFSRTKQLEGNIWWKQVAPIHVEAQHETQVMLPVPPAEGAGSDDAPPQHDGSGQGQGSGR